MPFQSRSPRDSLLARLLSRRWEIAVCAGAVALPLWAWRLARPGAQLRPLPQSVARTQSCLGNLGRIAQGFVLYAQDFDGKFPRGVDFEDRFNPAIWQRPRNRGGVYASDARTAPMLHDLLHSYIRDRAAWRCPDDRGWERSNLPGFNEGLRHVRPSAWRKYGSSYSYLTLRGFAGLRPGDFADPSRSPSLFDAHLWHRPGGRLSLNVLFADGHAQTVPAAQFSDLSARDALEIDRILQARTAPTQN